METYVRKNVLPFSKEMYGFQFSIGSPIRDGQDIEVVTDGKTYSINLGYMYYFALTRISDKDLFNNRLTLIQKRLNGLYEIKNSQIIEDLIYRSCQLLSTSDLRHFLLCNQQYILDIIIDRVLIISEGHLVLETDDRYFQSIPLLNDLPVDYYSLFTLLSNRGELAVYLLGQKQDVRVQLTDLPSFYMIEEGIDLTGQPKGRDYQFSALNNNLYEVTSKVSHFLTIAYVI